jgi:hypothetical protein
MRLLYALEVYATNDRAILEVGFDEDERRQSLEEHLERLGSDATGYRLGTFEGDDLATGYVAVEQNEATVDGQRWQDIAVVPVHSSNPPQVPEAREPRPRSLNPADELYQADVSEMLEAMKEVERQALASSAAQPTDEDLAYQAKTAQQIVNALQIMAAASTEEMARQQRDILWPLLSTCAINGWHHISDPIADFVMDTRPSAEALPG